MIGEHTQARGKTRKELLHDVMEGRDYSHLIQSKSRYGTVYEKASQKHAADSRRLKKKRSQHYEKLFFIT